jgi:hypothetical protein
MGTLDDLQAGLGLDLGDHVVGVGTVVGQARADVDDGGLLLQGHVPELDLGQPLDDGRARTAAAVEDAQDLGLPVLVALELALAPVEGHQASGTADADVVHGIAASDDENLFHANLLWIVVPPP